MSNHTGIRAVQCVAVAIATLVMSGCTATPRASEIKSQLEDQGLTNVDLTFPDGLEWRFEADAYPGCRLAGYKSSIDDGWYLLGYFNPNQKWANWPAINAADAAITDSSLCL